MSEITTLLAKPPAAPRFRGQRVLAFAANAAIAERLAAALDRADVELHVIITDRPDLIAQLVPSREPDAVLVDADLSDAGSGPIIEHTIRTRLDGRPLLVRAGDLRPDAVRRLMRLCATELVDADAPPETLAAAVQRTLASRKSATSARVTAFFSPRGGVGVSTLAVETAVAISQRLPANNNGACLVDLNFQFGIDAALLNIRAALKTGGNLDVSRVDEQMLDAFLADHKSRLQVLAAPPDWREMQISNDSVARLLDLSAERFAHLIVDMPKDLTAVSEAVITSADQFFLVTDLTVPGLQLARAAVAALDTRLHSSAMLSVIVNRVPRWESGAALNMRDVHRMLQCDRIHLIYEDTSTASEAMDRGEQVLSSRPDSRLAREIGEAIRHAFPTEFGEPATQDRKKVGFLNLAKYR